LTAPAAPIAAPRAGQVAASAALGLAGQAAQVLVLVVALPLLVRTLGAETYGVLNVVLVAVAYLTLLNCGLAQGLTKLGAEALGRGASREIPALFWTSTAAVGVLGLAGAALLAVAAPLLVERVFAIPASLAGPATSALRVGALAVPTAILILNFNGVLDAHHRFDLTNSLRPLATIFNTLLPLAAGLAGAGLGTMVGLITAKNAVFAVLLFALAWAFVPAIHGGPRWDPAVARRLFTFAGWTALLSPSVVVLGTLDRLLIGVVLGMKALTYYAVPQQITNTLGGLVLSVMPVLYPTFSRLFEADRARMRSLHREAAGCIALGLGLACFLLAVCGREILTVWMGRDFGASAPVLEILSLGLFLSSIHPVTSTLLQGTRYVRLVVAITYVTFAVQATLVWVLMGRWGVLGAAWASALTQALALALLMGGAVRVGLLDRRHLLPGRVAAVCAALAILAPVLLYVKTVLKPSPWTVIAAAAVFAPAYAIASWRHVLEAPTRAALRGTLARWRGVVPAPLPQEPA
jgi:O-antigen/teichoic acid export membrane protein